MTETTKKNVLRSRAAKNEKYRHTSLEMETSTHFPLLIKTVQMTKGPIVEIGSGMFSTPLLHWLCFDSKRKLITCENYPHYLDFANKFKTDNHEIRAMGDWQKETFDDFKDHYSVVFIDHSTKHAKGHTRGDDAAKFKDKADFVVLHDAGDNSHSKYGYEKIYPLFKYRYDWKGCWPATTVLSNFIDVSKWKKL